jgi:type IV pilus assembly protein PilW
MRAQALRSPVPCRTRQRGLTLIELLVSMAIAVFLLGGLLTILGNTRRVFGAQNSMAQFQDNQRLVMTLLGDVIQQAGYFPNPTVNVATTALPVAGVTFPTAGQAITGTYQAAVPNDTITVRFATTQNDGVINCTGGSNTTTVTPPLVYVNQFSVDAAGNLVCTLTANGVVAPPVTLVSGIQGQPGIQNLQILYGVTTNPAAGTGAVDTYLRADQVTATNNWLNVASVKVRVTFRNPLSGQPGQLATTVPFERVIGVMNHTGVKL